MSDNNDKPIIISGWLYKMRRNNSFFTPTWDKRWVVIQNDSISWRHSKKGTVAGSIDICHLESIHKVKKVKTLAKDVEINDKSIYKQHNDNDRILVLKSKKRILCLMTSHGKECDKWSRAIQLQMDLRSGGTFSGPQNEKNRRKSNGGNDKYELMMQSLNRKLMQISTCQLGDPKVQLNENARERNWIIFESSRFKSSADDLSSPKQSDFTTLDNFLRINDNIQRMKKVSKSRSFYFASKSNSRYYTVDDDYQFFLSHGDSFIDIVPTGSNPYDFNCRPLPSLIQSQKSDDESSIIVQRRRLSLEDDPLIGTYLIPRKVPVKVEPKAIFAAERTLFAWIRSALFIFGASLTVLKYSDNNEPVKLIYGCMLLPISLAFIIYPLIRYQSRVRMLTQKDPGPYYDIIGPSCLATMVMLVIVFQFCLRLSHFWYD